MDGQTKMKHCTSPSCDRRMWLGNAICCPFCGSALEDVEAVGEISREWTCPRCGGINSRMQVNSEGETEIVCNRCGIFCELVLIETAPAKKGHPLFYRLTEEEVNQYERKNADYANQTRPMGNFERVGRILSLYPALSLGDPTVVCLVYMLKQLDCVLHLLEEKREGTVEGVDSRLADVHTYAKIARIVYREQHESEEGDTVLLTQRVAVESTTLPAQS